MNNFILDVRAHRDDGLPGEAIINLEPGEYFMKSDRWYSVGIHPWRTNQYTDSDLDQLNLLYKHPQVLAIGETGFDRLKNFDLGVQMDMFKLHHNLAKDARKPLIIHMVHALDLVLKMRKELCSDIPWIIHGFRGNRKQAEQLLDAGMYLSFGEKYQLDALRSTPLDRMFLETDEATCDIDCILEKVARDLDMYPEDLEEEITANIDEAFFPDK